MTKGWSGITESSVEQNALSWFENLGYHTETGSNLSPGEPGAERGDYSEAILADRLRTALREINPQLPPDAIDDAFRIITRHYSPNLVENNRHFHRLLTEGIDVSYPGDDRQVHDKAWLLDLNNPEANDWLVVNQFLVTEDRRSRRLDMVVFVNGLPLAVFELKNPTDETATLQNAYGQFQTYKKEIPSLFKYNELLVVSDGLQARAGTITAGWDRYMPWRTVDGTAIAPKDSVALEVLINGMFTKQRFLDLILNFIVFDDNGQEIFKKAAAYHQYHAVNKAVACTFSACGYFYDPGVLTGRYPAFKEEEKPRPAKSVKAPDVPYGAGTKHFGGRRIGVVWHTQGSGKSLTMAFFAGKLIRHPGMKNPTIVVITDRNDLDEQLFGTFNNRKDLLRQIPKQAADRAHLRELLNTGSGGVIFTTIQKFFPGSKGDTYPRLSERENIVVIADEAHRSQYDFIDGFARHLRDALPHASFIGRLYRPGRPTQIRPFPVYPGRGPGRSRT